MEITIEIPQKATDVCNASRVMNAMYFSKMKIREMDRDSGRQPTSFEDEQFEGLALASKIVDLVCREVYRAQTLPPKEDDGA